VQDSANAWKRRQAAVTLERWKDEEATDRLHKAKRRKETTGPGWRQDGKHIARRSLQGRVIRCAPIAVSPIWICDFWQFAACKFARCDVTRDEVHVACRSDPRRTKKLWGDDALRVRETRSTCHLMHCRLPGQLQLDTSLDILSSLIA
jgi:hypothetical protein